MTVKNKNKYKKMVFLLDLIKKKRRKKDKNFWRQTYQLSIIIFFFPVTINDQPSTLLRFKFITTFSKRNKTSLNRKKKSIYWSPSIFTFQSSRQNILRHYFILNTEPYETMKRICKYCVLKININFRLSHITNIIIHSSLIMMKSFIFIS